MAITVASFGILGYIGPGAGMGLLGALGGLLLAVASALGFILLWPIRKLMRRLRQANSESDATATAKHEAAG